MSEGRMWDEETRSWVPMGPRPVDRSREARSARGIAWFFAAACFVLVVAATFSVTVVLSRDDSIRRADPAPTIPVTTLPVAGSIPGIGPPPGADVAAYLANRAAAFTGAAAGEQTERIAVVSFKAYVKETDARLALGDLDVKAWLLAPPGQAPTVVTDGLEAWSSRQREADEKERGEIAALIPTSGNDPEFQAFYRSEVARLDKAIAEVSPDAEVVFAAVVVAPPSDLADVAGEETVRLVDIGPAGNATDDEQEWRGLRPEEQSRAGQPAVRPVADAD